MGQVEQRLWDHSGMANEGHPPVQCSSATFWAFELERALDLIAEAGFTEIELMVTRDPSTQSADIPLKLAEERGIKIASVHGPFLAITKTVWGMDPIGKIERGLEMCTEVGASTLVVHPPFLWERSYVEWLAEEAAQRESETGITIAVETMYPKWVAGRRLRAYRWLRPASLEAAVSSAVIDTSHLAVAREDILEALETLGPKLAHIHLSDNAGDGRDGHLPVEQGILPLDRFLAELGRSDYAGAVCLELSVRRFVERPEELVEMLKQNKIYVEEHLAGKRKISKGLPRS